MVVALLNNASLHYVFGHFLNDIFLVGGVWIGAFINGKGLIL